MKIICFRRHPSLKSQLELSGKHPLHRQNSHYLLIALLIKTEKIIILEKSMVEKEKRKFIK